MQAKGVVPKTNERYLQEHTPVQHARLTRLALLTIVIGGITLLALGGPRGLISRFHGTVPIAKARLITFSSFAAALGVSVIFCRALFGESKIGKQPLFAKEGQPTFEMLHGGVPKRGHFWGDAHWKRVTVTGEGEMEPHQNIDLSTLDEKGTGYTFGYLAKDEACSSTGVALACLETAPLYASGTIVYNAIRAIVAPLFIGGSLACGNPHKFSFSDIPKEFGKSIWRIVRTPFYITAYIFALLYMIVDPPNGRKLVANIEQDWNDGALCENNFWSVRGRQKGFKFGCEGRSTLFIAGCLQPKTVLRFEEGKIVSAKPIHAGYTIEVAI